MITLQKVGDALKFTFTDNPLYLQNGTIEVPVNSLTLVTDNSGIATFKKSASNDIFVCASYDELGMSKAELEDWFKANACSANGGSAVKEMYLGTNYDTVDAETGVVTKYQVGDTVSGHTIVEEDFHYLIYVYVNDDEEYSLVKVDMENYITENEFASGTTVTGHIVHGVVDPNSEQYLTVGADGFKVSGIDAALSGKTDVSAFTAHTADATIHLTSGDVENQIDTAISGKADTTAVTQEISAAVSGKVDTSTYTAYTAATEAVLSGKTSVVNVTQAEYDALVTGGTVDPTVLYNITDATAVDITQYWTSAQTNSAITQAVSGKQDTLSAGTNITIVDNVISAEGGGKAVSGGTNISITTGATADTINCTLPLSCSTYGYNIVGNFENNSSTIKSNSSNYYNFVYGERNSINYIYDGGSFGGNNAIFGMINKIHTEDIGIPSNNFICGRGNVLSSMTNNFNSSFVCGGNNNGNSSCQVLGGINNKATNMYETGFGRYNNSVSGSSTFGDSGNTLFSIGNGTANNARHNAFEIRQNGDIYCSDGTNDVKLQDTITATAANTTALGGLSLVKLTQAEYDALVTKDNSTLYVIIN